MTAPRARRTASRFVNLFHPFGDVRGCNLLCGGPFALPVSSPDTCRRINIVLHVIILSHDSGELFVVSMYSGSTPIPHHPIAEHAPTQYYCSTIIKREKKKTKTKYTRSIIEKSRDCLTENIHIYQTKSFTFQLFQNILLLNLNTSFLPFFNTSL